MDACTPSFAQTNEELMVQEYIVIAKNPQLSPQLFRFPLLRKE